MKPVLCRIAQGIRLTFDWFMAMVDALFNKHRFVRRTIVFIALTLIAFTIYVTMPKLNGNDAVTAQRDVLAILAVVIGFYQYLRNKDGD